MSIKTWTYAVAAAGAAFAVLTVGGHFLGGDYSFANESPEQCAAKCRAGENACRIATSGDDAKCGAELTKCLQACRAK